MLKIIDPFRFVLPAVSGRMNQRHVQMIDYLREENKVLREITAYLPRSKADRRKLNFTSAHSREPTTEPSPIKPRSKSAHYISSA